MPSWITWTGYLGSPRHHALRAKPAHPARRSARTNLPRSTSSMNLPSASTPAITPSSSSPSSNSATRPRRRRTQLDTMRQADRIVDLGPVQAFTAGICCQRHPRPAPQKQAFPDRSLPTKKNDPSAPRRIPTAPRRMASPPQSHSCRLDHPPLRSAAQPQGIRSPPAAPATQRSLRSLRLRQIHPHPRPPPPPRRERPPNKIYQARISTPKQLTAAFTSLPEPYVQSRRSRPVPHRQNPRSPQPPTSAPSTAFARSTPPSRPVSAATTPAPSVAQRRAARPAKAPDASSWK